MGAAEAGPSGLSTARPSEAGPSGLGTTVGASTQTALLSQPSPSSASEPADSGLQAADSLVGDNSQTDLDLNDENSEIRRRRLERFLSSTSQESSDKDKND